MNKVSDPGWHPPHDARLPKLPQGPNHSPALSPSRPGDPGRDRWQASPARDPFDRLQWWTVRHQLRERLAPYEATDASPMFWRGASWTTLKYWAMLIDGYEIEEAVKV